MDLDERLTSKMFGNLMSSKADTSKVSRTERCRTQKGAQRTSWTRRLLDSCFFVAPAGPEGKEAPVGRQR